MLNNTISITKSKLCPTGGVISLIFPIAKSWHCFNCSLICRWIGSKETMKTEVEETIRLSGTQPSSVVIPADRVKNLPQSSKWVIVVLFIHLMSVKDC